MLNLAKLAMLDNAEPAGSTCDLKIAHDHAYGFGESDGGDSEIRAAQAKGGQAYKERRKRSDGRSFDESQIRAAAGVNHQSGGVCSQAIADGKAERDLSGEATHQVPGNAGDCPDVCNKEDTNQVGTQPR